MISLRFVWLCAIPVLVGWLLGLAVHSIETTLSCLAPGIEACAEGWR